MSNPGVSTELSRTPASEILLTDFFGGIAGVEVTDTETLSDSAAEADWTTEAAAAKADEATRAAKPVRALRQATNASTNETKTGFTPATAAVSPVQGIVGAVAIAAAGYAALAFARK
jgi:phosphatidylinositol glycan class K